MPLIRSRSRLIIDAVAADNPDLPFVPTLENCYVYGLQTVQAKKSVAMIHGRFGTGYRGRIQVWFNKYDVKTLTHNCDRNVINNGGKTTLAYLEEINRRYGFELKPNEIQDLPVMSGGTICRLTIQLECLMYTGTVDFRITEPQPDLSELITIRDLEPQFNTHGMGTAIPGAVLAQGHDYSDVADVLSAVTGTLDTASATSLSTALQSIDTVPWGIVAETLYSLVGAEVLYSGPTVGLPAELQVNDLLMPGYAYVLVLKPAHVNTGLTATPILYHYNVYTAIRS